jgi:large subunit ribosomal protein LX
MSQVKTFEITGYIKKSGRKITFAKNLKALKKSDALEKIYSEIGSRHKAKRFDVKVTNVKEMEQAKEPK